MLSPYWPYILVATLLLALCAALALFLVLRRARRRAAAPPAARPAGAQVGFIQQPAASSVGLKVSFSRSLRALRRHVTLRDYRYRLPWFLLVGEESSGKTTLLAESGMSLPLDRPAEQLHGVKQGLNWFFFDRAVVLDVAGEMVLRSDCETSNGRGWATISRLLQKHRPERPLDGVVLTIPCADLLAGRGLAPDQRARLEQKAVCLYRKLWEAQKQLGMSFPVYVVVTKCDQVPGFRSFCRELPARLRDEMFGWSSPYTLETAYRPEWVGEAFQNVYRYLFQAQVELLAEGGEVEDRDGIFLLPSEVQQLRAPLQLYLDQIFKQSSFHDSFFFRGLYFTGDAGDEAAAAHVLLPPRDADAPGPDREWLEEALELDREEAVRDVFEAPQARRPAFVRDLFEKKIFQEGMLARPLVKARLSRNRTAFAAQVLALAIPVTGCAGLALTYPRLERHRDELHGLLAQEKKDMEEVVRLRREAPSRPRLSDFYDGLDGESSYAPQAAPPGAGVYADAALAPRGAAAADFALAGAEGAPGGTYPSALHDNTHNMLAAMSRVSGGSLYSVFIPSSWFSGLNQSTRDSVADGFKYIILEGLRSELDYRTETFLHAAPIQDFSAPAYQAAPGYDAAPPWAGPGHPPAGGAGAVHPLYDQRFMPDDDGTLRGFIERFAELRAARALYEGLIREGSGSLQDLKALGAYLGHKEPSENFDSDNPLFREALRKAQGRPLAEESKKVLREVADNVAGMVEALYHRSFERQTSTVSYDYLRDIAQTEELLARPEHTWLSTYVFDARSSFHGMTLPAGLREMRAALEGLRRESFMSPVSAGAPRAAARPRRELVWDGQLLRRATAWCDEYERFAAGRCDNSNPVNDAVCQAAFARLKANVSALVAQAQTYRPAPAAPGESPALAGLRAEVLSLQAEQETLSKLLAASDRLSLQEGLRPQLAGQAEALLRVVDGLFLKSFYAAPPPDFSRWDGSTPVAAPAFGADSQDDLAGYLAEQRKGVALLARDLAAPLLDFAAANRIPEPRTRVDWKRLLALLADYDEKKPGNSLGALESFILTGMDKANPDNCQEMDGGAEGPRDLFVAKRNQLRTLLRRRCVAIADDRARRAELLIADRGRRAALVAVAAYGEIAEEFNSKLSDHFPFGAPAGPPYKEADPERVLAFFKLLKEKGPTARKALQPGHRLGAAGDEALEFLDRMEGVRLFFADYLEKKKGLALDFDLEFRVNREHEEGAAQIIDWTFDVGRRKYGYHDKELGGRWAFGEPVRLTLRWANNSPLVPDDAPGGYTHLRARDRVAVFEYRNRWSLLMMLLRQQPSPTDFSPHGVDTDVHTLRFTVPTRADGKYFDSLRETPKSGEARVFMRLSLLAPGAKEPLLLPHFPDYAPGLPAAPPYGR